MMSDLISRQDAIDAISTWDKFGIDERNRVVRWYEGLEPYVKLRDVVWAIVKMPSAQRDEESELKFYYVESIDDYWIGQRLDNFYYADWHDRLGFVWSKSRYLPWGEHIIDENTLWKEHTYPSEPVEIPFTTWIVGFMKKHSAERTGKWNKAESIYWTYVCSECGRAEDIRHNFCPNCGAKMEGEQDE